LTDHATTLKDVATRAGLSVGIVSMALADDPRVAPSTRAAVLRVAHELDYVPNSAARALRAQRLDIRRWCGLSGGVPDAGPG